MLLQIRDFLQQQKIASSQQIAREFSLDTAALQPMLDIWLKKQVIAVCREESACKTRCSSRCTREFLVYYRIL